MPKFLGHLSVHKNGGWHSQWARLHRWYDRLKNPGLRKPQPSSEETCDFAIAFFQTCYHLRDYLKADGIEETKLAELFKGSVALELCRDICNGTKHCNLNCASVDAHFAIGREYVPKGIPYSQYANNEAWFVIAGEKKYDLLELAQDCLAAWAGFLNCEGLIPRQGAVRQGTASAVPQKEREESGFSR